ncbi:MAG TPA: SDR family NAD(P)-dependent oxidoreductase [Acidimicrobiia bacterium]|jgi:NAD(P)-dependent dehydrogenase (short-subunit alcohol dehydrogenase family)
MFDLSGKTAVVTGAGQNVGAGIARALAAQGATVQVNDIVGARAQGTVDQIVDAGGTAAVASFDVTDYDAVTDAMAAIGTVDILVNNAGNGGAEGMGLVQFRDSEPAGWMGAINVNLFGVLHCSRAVINGMCERGFGRVITISSGAGITGLRIGVSPYAAGKGGAIAFMRHLAIENARSGVTANSLALGLMQPENSGPVDALAQQIPVGRTGTPEDVGFGCVYLASDEASWITGQTIHLDGGATFG